MTPLLPRRRVLWRRTSAAAAGALAAVLALSSCGLFGGPDLDAEPLPSASGETEPALARFYGQRPQWRECRATMECAEVTVPLDYEQPDGAAIILSVLRVPATDPDRRIGSLLVNPGGPGGSGVDYAAAAETYFGEEVRAVYDVVGFDPRGVGESTPIDCLTDTELDEFVASDPDPDDRVEVREARSLMRGFGQGCLDRSGDLTRHVSTEEAARDMDVLRQVLGQDRLAYFGASYGTFLGATYADLFPERVGRLVLDGAIDPTKSGVETSLVQAEGFETALTAYVENCVDDGDCYLGGSSAEGLQRIRDLLAEVDAEPLPAAEGRPLTQGLAVLGIWAPLYNRDYWPALDQALSRALRGDGAMLLSFADSYVGRGPEGYVDNSSEALYAVNCLDHDEWVTWRDVRRLEPRFEAVSPTFGRIFAAGLTSCGDWSVHSGKGPRALVAEGSAPIMVVGTSRDPATPLRWAEALASQLDNAVLVRRDGDGHTGYRAGNECVDEAVEGYLVSGAVPEATVDC